MKKTRILVFLCAVLLIVAALGIASAAPSASLKSTGAQPKSTARNSYWYPYYTLRNGETVNLTTLDYPYCFYTDEDGSTIYDVYFDTENPVKGKSNVKWIKITKYSQGFIMSIDSNFTAKARTGKVTVTAAGGYKATMVIRQLGVDSISSAKRSKKTITLKFKYSSGADGHWLSVYREKLNKKGVPQSDTSETIYYDLYSAKTYKLTVEKGYEYTFYVGPARAYTSTYYDYDDGAESLATYYEYSSTSEAGFTVKKVTGSAAPDWKWTDGKY